MKLTTKDLTRLQKEGKIKGVGKVEKTISKEKAWIMQTLKSWCEVNKEPFEEEHRFHPSRRWRFDWCLPTLKLAIEYNGIMSAKSRHTSITGYTGDLEKLNAAQLLGWKVLQYTPLNYKNLLNDLNNLP